MGINAIGPAGSLPSSVTDLKARLEKLQQQLATGRQATTYGGLGQSRSLSLALRSEIGRIETFKATIQTANLRLNVADNVLQRVQAISDENRSGLLVSPYLVGGDGRTQAQYTAQATLAELVSLLNSQVNGHHLFAGRSADSPPVIGETEILDGAGGRAGFRQVLAERRTADLGAGDPQLLTTIVGTGATATGPDAPATISSGNLGADADISLTGTQIGTGSGQAVNGILADGDTIDIEINGAVYSINFDAAHVGHNVVGTTLNFDLDDPANTVADLDDQITSLLTGTGVTVTEAGGQLTFSGDPTVEYIRFTDNAGSPVAGLGLNASGYGTSPTDRLATRNTAFDQLAFEGATLQVDFGGVTVGTVQFGTGANVSNVAELVSTIDAFAGVSATEAGGVVTIAAADPADADSSIVLTGNSNATLETLLGFTPDAGGGSVSTASPTNLLSPANGVSPGDTLTIRIGSESKTITFGNNFGEVSTFAELSATLNTTTFGTVTVATSGPDIGNITIVADDPSDSVTISGSPGTAARFGLSEGTYSDLVLGRLSEPTAVGADVTVAEDGAGHPFGFKLTNVSSELTGATVVGPSGSPVGIQVSFSATLPLEGEKIEIDVRLPDGSVTQFSLTATSVLPPEVGQFTIGADENATASNFAAALTSEIERVATTELAAASAIQAATDFFEYDSGTPPQRVDGPPFETATALVDATTADTVFWYVGDLYVDGRETAVARVDTSLSVAYGARADEPALRDVVKYIALLSAEKFDANVEVDEERYNQLKNRLIPLMAGAGGRPKVRDMAIELAQKRVVINSTDKRHDEALAFTTGTLDELEGANLDEVAAGILRLQTQLQASFETTAILARLTIVNFL